MDLASAKSELRHPPAVNIRMILMEAISTLAVAYMLFLIFG